MAPPVEAFVPSQLSQRVQFKPDGRARKPGVELSRDCALMEMLQYACDLDGPRQDPRSKVVCQPVLRLFRRYVKVEGKRLSLVDEYLTGGKLVVQMD